MLRRLRHWNDWAPVPLRIILGIGFMIHGYPKVFEGGHAGLADTLAKHGIPLAEALGWAGAFVEFFGGLLLIVGAFVPIVALLALIQMAMAMFLVHWGNGWKVTNSPPGIELNMLYIAGFAALLIGGAGMLSVDWWMARRLDDDDR